MTSWEDLSQNMKLFRTTSQPHYQEFDVTRMSEAISLRDAVARQELSWPDQVLMSSPA
jgi:hypothetical protein